MKEGKENPVESRVGGKVAKEVPACEKGSVMKQKVAISAERSILISMRMFKLITT